MAEWFIAQEAEHRKHFTQVYSEIKAKWLIELDGKPFTLTTQIDRLSVAADGSFSLVDYKTGAIPDDSDQLRLEAMAPTDQGSAVRKSRYTEEKTVAMLREAARSPLAKMRKVVMVAERHAVSEQTIYKRQHFGTMEKAAT